jgi:hypothetical protein
MVWRMVWKLKCVISAEKLRVFLVSTNELVGPVVFNPNVKPVKILEG